MSNDIIYRQRGKDYYYKTWHTIDKNMFLFVHSGDGSIVSREKTYPMSSGLLCFIGADRYHYTFPEHIDAYERSKLFIPSEELSRLTRLLGAQSVFSELFGNGALVFSELKGEDAVACGEIFRVLNDASSDAELFRAELYSAAIRLMILMSKNVTEKPPRLSGAMQRTVEYINSHISEPISIETLCSVSFMSKYHFCRQFKRQTGLTVMEYVLKTRIIMAKELLHSGERSIGEVSDLCGFSSLSYFSRVFKESTGVTPMQYKKGCHSDTDT